ncbi:hypothetical protein NDU88_004067 [Pleurodeles waltl]|uniref:Uncharacterized protein n=1 Tax=Pleurodeles waltl TaxID=8319 RepID=A0AAV7QBI5_PLEWA|nr:hypothetical protein NDU88_004067 [Pleurodeles waltl]
MAGGCGCSHWVVWRYGFCALRRRRPGGAASRPVRYTGASGVLSAGCEVCGSCRRDREKGEVAWREEESDTSIEEGELVESRSESHWWERGKGRGVANPVLKSLQVDKRLLGRPGGRKKEGPRLEVWTAQQRPPFLSPGKESMSSMVSVATEAREDSVRLVKGVDVQDTGVATDAREGEKAVGDATKGGGLWPGRRLATGSERVWCWVQKRRAFPFG